MLKLVTTSNFRKEYKLAKRRGMDIELLDSVIQTLLEEKQLASKFCDHDLHDNYEGFRECHLNPDWLLIYRIEKYRNIGCLPNRNTQRFILV